MKEDEKSRRVCRGENEVYEKDCAKAWVGHVSLSGFQSWRGRESYFLREREIMVMCMEAGLAKPGVKGGNWKMQFCGDFAESLGVDALT